MKKNLYLKKAENFTLAEFMKIVLGIMSIGLLLVLAASMYGIFSKKSEIEQARATLKQITETMNNLKEGEQKTFLLESPKSWVLIYYGKDINGNLDFRMPQLCKGKNCLCICNYQGQNPDCDSFGVCENLENIQKTSEISFGVVVDIKNIFISKSGGNILIERTAGAYKKSEEIFTKILNYKYKENSKTIEEFSVGYVSDLTPKKIEENTGIYSDYTNENELTSAIKSYFVNGAFVFKISSSDGKDVFRKEGGDASHSTFSYTEHEKEIINSKGEKYKIYAKLYGS